MIIISLVWEAGRLGLPYFAWVASISTAANCRYKTIRFVLFTKIVVQFSDWLTLQERSSSRIRRNTGKARHPLGTLALSNAQNGLLGMEVDRPHTFPRSDLEAV
jgi:hypothetical protein